jgi:hypothetical protein
MMLDLTKQYSALFRKQGGKQFFLFARDVFKSGKLRELSSFILWELLHQLRLFPKSQYIRFQQGQHLALDNEAVSSDEFHARVVGFFASRGLNARRCSHTWKLLFMNRKKEIFGCVYPDDCDLYKSGDNGESLAFLKRFPEPIKAIFVSSAGTIFVCVTGSVYRSADNGRSFQKALDFAAPESFFRFNNAMTEMPDKTLIIGEYGNVWDEHGWRKLAYLYFSSDDGQTWEQSDFLITKGTNKHVHVVKYSPLLDRLLVADGDNYKKLWISAPLPVFNPQHPQFTAVNRFHVQIGGYTSVTESEGKILFGTDYQGGTNFIVQTVDGVRYPRRIVPDPYRRSPIDNMVPRKAKHGTEVWANLPFSTARTKCLLMFTRDNGETWNKVIDYDGAAHKVWLLNAADGVSDTLYFSVQDLRKNDRVVYEITDCR